MPEDAMTKLPFRDRKEAGSQLASLLENYKNRSDTLILGLARGGVVTAASVAVKLHLPLDVMCPRKVGAPFNPELAIGAITETGEGIFHTSLIQQLEVTQAYLEHQVQLERQEAKHRLKIYRAGLPERSLSGKNVILVDDGLATGATMKAAISSARAERAKKVIVAVPVSPEDTLEAIRELADEVACLATPPFFQAVGQFYEDFSATEDEEVIALLQSHSHRRDFPQTK